MVEKTLNEWGKPLTNDERIEILFMKIQELEERIEKLETIKNKVIILENE